MDATLNIISLGCQIGSVPAESARAEEKDTRERRVGTQADGRGLMNRATFRRTRLRVPVFE